MHAFARPRAPLYELHYRAHLFEGDSQSLGGPHQSQVYQGFFIVDPISVGQTRRPGDNAAPFVVPDR